MDKGDVFEVLEAHQFKDTAQLVGGIFILKKCQETELFLNEWFKYAKQHQLISDSPSVFPNYPEFRDHRHDQAIFSLLIKKRQIISIPDGTYPPNKNQPISATRF